MDEATRRCPSCGVTKPVLEFGRNRARKDGLSFYCKICSRAKSRDYMARNPRSRERRREYLRDIYVNDPDRYLDYRYRNKFGITLARYREILESQGGACAVCGIRAEDCRQMLSVDHDHSCCPEKKRSCGACVRGLLCSSCNFAIGLLNDDPEAMARAIDYLNAWSEKVMRDDKHPA